MEPHLDPSGPPAPSRSDYEEAARRKRVIDLARSIIIRHPDSVSYVDAFQIGEEFDAMCEKYRTTGAL